METIDRYESTKDASSRLRRDPLEKFSTMTVATLGLAALTYALLLSLVSPALLTMEHSLGTTEGGITWVLTAYVLSAAVAIPVVGRLGDLYGRRRMLLVCLTGVVIGTVVSALASDMRAMIVGRVIQALGGGVFPLAYGILRDQLPAERVGRAIGVVTALFGLGAGFGVVFSGLILRTLNYHWLFWIPSVVSLIALLATVLLVPEARQRAAIEGSWSAALLMSIGLTALLVAVSQTSVSGWGSLHTVVLAGIGVLFLVVWGGFERRSRNSLVDERVVAFRWVWVTNLLALALGASMFVAAALIPRIAQSPSSGDHRPSTSVLGAGAVLVVLVLLIVLVSFLAGRVEAAWGPKVPAGIGTAFSLAAFVILVGAHNQMWTVALASALLGAGAGFALAPMAELVGQAVPAARNVEARRVNEVSQSVGLVLGGQLGATVLANSAFTGAPGITGSNNALLLAIAALVLALLALGAHSGRRRAGKTAERCDRSEQVMSQASRQRGTESICHRKASKSMGGTS